MGQSDNMVLKQNGVNKMSNTVSKIEAKEELKRFFEDERIQNLQVYIVEKEKTEKEKFNIFKVLRLDNHEIRHSNFLAWLLDPRESHLLKNQFLKHFLNISIGNNIDQIMYVDDIKIEKEYSTDKNRRIDLLIHSKIAEFVCVIENKYGSQEHDEQCKHYKDFIENKFSKYKHKYFIFLDIEEPTKELLEKELKGYIPITYKQVHDILVSLVSRKIPNNIVKEIIVQYIDLIEEKYSMLDENIKNHCKEIYGKYNNVLTIMDDYKKELQTDIFNLMKELLKSNELGLKNVDIKGCGYNDLTGCGIRFIPEEFYNDPKVLGQNKTTTQPLFFALMYKTELTLTIWSIESNEKWNSHNSITIDFLNKTDQEIKNLITNSIKEMRKDVILFLTTPQIDASVC